MCITADNYYQLPLSERKLALNTISERYLCKSIVLENTHYNEQLIANKVDK